LRKIVVTNAGRGAAINFCRSIRLSPEPIEIIGLEQSKYSIQNAEADKKILCPSVTSEHYFDFLKYVIDETKADFLYPSKTNDELWLISKRRHELNIKTFLPDDNAIRLYEDKFKTYELLRNAGIKVPETMLISNESDIEKALSKFPKGIWLRAIKGCGGKGSIPTDSFSMAREWINRFNGWSNFTASEILSDKTATWSGLWKDGELIVSQIRKRLYWEFSYLSPSGVTGITGAQVTEEDPLIDDLAIKSIKAITDKPHGIVSVDFTYDFSGIPNPTEIQASRFYTSSYFMAKAGLNLPYLLVKIALGEEIPKYEKKFSPLENGLVWIKYVDCEPILTTTREVNIYEEELQEWCCTNHKLI
jgi:Predicted ATP-grasp enzyme